jgi:hypothetical protein
VSPEDVDALDEGMFGRRAKEFFEFGIYQADDSHIVTLRLRKQEGMTIGDTTQLQNFLWTQVGQAIRDNKELQRTLRHGGIEVLLEDPNPPMAEPGAN